MCNKDWEMTGKKKKQVKCSIKRLKEAAQFYDFHSVILFHEMKGLLRLTLSKIMCNISATVQHQKNSAKIASRFYHRPVNNETQNFE